MTQILKILSKLCHLISIIYAPTSALISIINVVMIELASQMLRPSLAANIQKTAIKCSCVI